MANKKYVLCVDDNPEDCDLVTTYLGWEDIAVSVVGTCADALDRAKSERFDLYIIDESLPDCNGAELTADIRAFDSTTPIIFHSAHGAAVLIEKAKQAGAQEYIVKQGDFDALVKIVKEHLGAREN